MMGELEVGGRESERNSERNSEPLYEGWAAVRVGLQFVRARTCSVVYARSACSSPSYCQPTNPSHGGKQVSNFLSARLPELIETVTPDDIPDVLESTLSLGGYFRRWRGGALQRWSKWANGDPPVPGTKLKLEERLTLAFLKVR
jgi:protein phosphatase PTC6